jgi:hypothetical protein
MWLNYVTIKFYILCRPLKKAHQIYENFNIYYECFDFLIHLDCCLFNFFSTSCLFSK